MFRQKLRRLPVLGSVYAIIAALGLVVLAVGVIGVAAVYTTNKHVRELEEVANRAFFAEHANTLVYAVVMDSRGIYMSADAPDRATYGAGVMKFLAELDATMAAWKQYVAPDDRNDFARAQARAQEFIRFRTELVRLGNEVGQGAARAWGDNDANRTNREALNREIDLLAKANYAELARLRAWINEYSIWQFMLAAATMAGGILLAILLIVLTFGRYRKEAATEVASKEAYLAEAQRLSHTGSFGWSAASGFVWSDETFRIFELDRATAPTVEAVIQRTHPEDRERVQRFIERASRDGGDWDVEHRLLLPDGAVKSLHVVVHAVRDEAGVLSFVGAVMDVTAAKRAEEAVQAAQAELAHVARMTTLGELTAWIAHEVNQPLAGIVTNGTACLQWLGQKNSGFGRGAQLGGGHDQRCAAGGRRHPRDSRAVEEDRAQAGSARHQRSDSRRRPPGGARGAGARRIGATEPRAGLAGGRRRSGPAAAGRHQPGDQCDPGHGIRHCRAAGAVDPVAAERSRSCAHRGRGLRPRHWVEQRRPAVQSLLHNQARRHGDGTVDLPVDHRGAWRQRMGDGEHAQRRRLPFHAAGGMKADGARSGSELGGCDETLQF